MITQSQSMPSLLQAQGSSKRKCCPEGLEGSLLPLLQAPLRRKGGFEAKRVRSFGDLSLPLMPKSADHQVPTGFPASPSTSSDEEAAVPVSFGGQGEKSLFEEVALHGWAQAAKNKLFRYDVLQVETKRLRGAYGFVAQLNEGRATKKRPTEFKVDQVVQAFDDRKFNFKKAGQDEVLFAFQLEAGLGKSHFEDQAPVQGSPHLVFINVSPIEYGHILLVPNVLGDLPQRLGPENLTLALHMASEADNPFFRVGFNSLGAYATVNHLHFQAYYLQEPFPCERCPVQPLGGGKALSRGRGVKVGLLKDFPVRGIVFEVGNCLEGLGRVVGEVSEALAARNVPHNLMIMDRGARVFLFPNRFSHAKAAGEVPSDVLDTGVNPACFEISGHIVLKQRADYDACDEASAWKLLEHASYPEGEFMQLVDACCGAYL